MNHARILPNFKTLLMAGSLFAITFSLANGCKTTSKTAGSSSNKMNSAKSLSDTATMSTVDSGGGKQTNGDKDKKP